MILLSMKMVISSSEFKRLNGDYMTNPYITMKGKTSITKNPLWFRKYWFKKRSRMKKEAVYYNQYLKQRIFSEVGISSKIIW